MLAWDVVGREVAREPSQVEHRCIGCLAAPGHLRRAGDDPGVQAVRQDGDLLLRRRRLGHVTLDERHLDAEIPECVDRLQPPPRPPRGDGIRPFGDRGDLIRHRLGDQQFGSEQAGLPDDEERAVHHRRGVDEITAAGDVLARRLQATSDTERIGELASFGHAQLQSKRREHPRHSCSNWKVEVFPDEYEQRDAHDDTDQKADAAQQHARQKLWGGDVAQRARRLPDPPVRQTTGDAADHIAYEDADGRSEARPSGVAEMCPPSTKPTSAPATAMIKRRISTKTTLRA